VSVPLRDPPQSPRRLPDRRPTDNPGPPPSSPPLRGRLPDRRRAPVPTTAPGGWRGRPIPRAAGPRSRRSPGTTALTWLLALFGLFATGLGLGQLTGGPSWHLFGDPNDGAPKSAALPRSEPTQLSIPRIKVAATVTSVGLAGDGTIEVPALSKKNTVGWYDRGPTPGQDGPAVLVGHVDTRSGPSVFATLSKLRKGDKVLVTRADHRIATFQVDAVRAYPKNAVPADQVYGDFSRPGLRLITCGGEWIGGSTGYADNIVVYASLAGG